MRTTFDVARFIWPVLLSAIFYFLVIAISAMTMVKPAYASGTVGQGGLYSSIGNEPACQNMSSMVAVGACMLQFNTATCIGCSSTTYTFYPPGGFSYCYTYKGNQYCGEEYFSFTAGCPANSTGTTTCTCDAGYVPDPTVTSCIPEPYTIALTGLGVTVMPTKTLTTAYALVTTSTGLPKSGAQVSLALTVVPELASQLPVTYTGTLSTYAGSTGSDGRLTFEFRAPTAGGTHTITASCTNCTNQTTGTIKVPGCLVEPLKDLPANDLCAQSLDAGLGKDVNGKCPKLDDRLPAQIQCFADKITATNATASPSIPYSGPTATIRNPAYQAHLQDVWDTMIKLNQSDNINNEACRPLRDKVIAEKGCDSNDKCLTGTPRCMAGSHCIDYRPPDYSNHSAGTAFDVPNDTINGLYHELTPLPPAPMTPLQKLQAHRIWIANWLATPTACNLYWGGNFTNPGPDFIHFQLR
jgi:hypothetical protein